MEIRDTRYARTPDGVYIAYQTAGEGPIDLAWQFDFLGDVDLHWQDPQFGPWFRALAGFTRLILHDRRGTGLSSRNVPPPNLETRVSDLRLVLDTIGSDRPVLAGSSEGGASHVLFAATEPERVRSILWFDPLPRSVWTPDFPWGAKSDFIELEERSLDLWGTNEFGAAFAEAEATVGHEIPAEEMPWWGIMSRHTGTPDVARELYRIWHETDIRGVLPAVQTPTLLIVHEGLREENRMGELVSSLMPNAQLASVPASVGTDDVQQLIHIVREFLGADRPAPELDTVLSTVLFTDIVNSTAKQASVGDRVWKGLVERHHALVRDCLKRWHGVENDTAGDGFYATFDGPARAIRCAQEITERVGGLGLEVRAGVHTGECELIDGKQGGIAVSIGARVASEARPSEVLVSQTVKDLVAGSGLAFEDAGEHELKGVPDRWRLYRATSR
jgi:class 3 adenylate cyclase